jgi:hypothetical protein
MFGRKHAGLSKTTLSLRVPLADVVGCRQPTIANNIFLKTIG